jgi:hypothetical protein
MEFSEVIETHLDCQAPSQCIVAGDHASRGWDCVDRRGD